MHRFFVSQESFEDSIATVTGAQVHQMRNVLRLKPGEKIILLDNAGNEYQVELTEVGKETVTGNILLKNEARAEAKTRVVLYQGLLKGEKFDLVLQKCTEIGVDAFVPVLCERSITGRGALSSDSRLARWRRILQEAAEQSHRGRIPQLCDPLDFSQAAKTAKGFALLGWEGEAVTSLRKAIADYRQENCEENPKNISLFIGPEGGFSLHEAELARVQGIVPFSLGPRILRAETAGIVATSLILYELGDLEHS